MEIPYGIHQLRERNIVTPDTVQCHVRDCNNVMPRQRHTFKCEPQFLCEEHGIYLSPTTFQYQDHLKNLLWHDADDQKLLSKIQKEKRTMARLGRERDEDALSWNIVRAFQKENGINQLARILLEEAALTLPELSEPEVIAQAQPGYCLVGFWGHGANSYAFYYSLVDEWRKVHFRLPYGGVYMDNEQCAQQIRTFLLRYFTVEEALRTTAQSLVAVDSMLYGYYRIVSKRGHIREFEEPICGRPDSEQAFQILLQPLRKAMRKQPAGP